MSRVCCVRTCRELSAETLLNGDPQPRTFRFPRDPIVRARWDLFVNTANRTTNFRGNAQAVCARHFQASCFKETGRLLPKSVPTIADRFSLNVATKFRITLAMRTTDLNIINDFKNTVVQLRDSEPQNTINELAQGDENAFTNTWNVKVEADENSATFRNCANIEVDENASPYTSSVKVEVEEPALGWNIILPPYGPVTSFTGDNYNPCDLATDVEAQDPSQGCCEPNLSQKQILDGIFLTESTVSDIKPEVNSNESELYIASEAGRQSKRKRVCSSEVSVEDFECPDRRRLNVQHVNYKLTSLRRQLKAENQKYRRVVKRLRSLHTVITELVKRTRFLMKLAIFFRFDTNIDDIK